MDVRTKRFQQSVAGALVVAGVAMSLAGPVGAVDGDGPFDPVYTPTSGVDGTTIEVSGPGCTPDQGQSATVSVALLDAGAASIVLGNGTADGIGDYDFEVVADGSVRGIPQLPPFAYEGTFRCIGPAIGPLFADFPYEVLLPTDAPASTGSLQVSSAAAPAGTPLVVQGPALDGFDGETNNGYVPNQAVKLVLYPGAVLIGQATINQTGALFAQVSIPFDTAPGDYTLVGFGSYASVAPAFTALTAAITVTGSNPGTTFPGPTSTSSTVPQTSTSATTPQSTSTSSTSTTAPQASTTAVTAPPATTTSTTAVSTTTTVAAFDPPDEPPSDVPTFDGISSGTAAPNGTLQIDEEGFVAGEDVPIVLYSTPQVLAVAKADSTGRVRATVSIPAGTPPGQHTLVLYGATTVKKAAVVVTSLAGVTTTRAAASPNGTLPRTGDASGSTSRLGAILILAGICLVTVARDRRRTN